MIKEYYRVKMSNFLDEETINTVLTGGNISSEKLLHDIVLSRLDRSSLMSFAFFITNDTKVITDQSTDASISFTRINQITELSQEEMILVESISSLEESLGLINSIVAQFDETVIFGHLELKCNKVAQNTTSQDLFSFFSEYDQESLKKFISIARDKGQEESEESLKCKMILSKMKTKIKESNISLGTINRLQNMEFNTVRDLQDLIDYN
jgi:hypothetical protein